MCGSLIHCRQPDTGQSCKTVDTRPLCHVVCLFKNIKNLVDDDDDDDNDVYLPVFASTNLYNLKRQ